MLTCQRNVVLYYAETNYHLFIIAHTENWFNSDTALAVCLVNILQISQLVICNL